jgi:hypothetical protein
MRSLAIVGLVLMLRTSPALAQSADGATSRIHLTSGLSLVLPAGWRELDSTQAQRVRTTLDTAMSSMQNTAFREALKHGQPASLFAAHRADQLAESVNLNAAPSPGTSPGAFDGVSDKDLAQALGQLCPAITEMISRIRQRVVRCEAPHGIRAGSRAAALTEIVRSGPTGFVHVWLVQIPDDNVVFTLTLSCLEAEVTREAPVLRGIWESLDIPMAR